MINKLVSDAIEAGKKEKARLVKEADEKKAAEEEAQSPIAFALRKLAKKMGEVPAPKPETSTKVATDNRALKGLLLLKRFVGGAYDCA